MSIQLKFAAPKGQAFYSTLRARVDQYFSTRNLSVHADWRMWLKTAFFLSVFAGLYLLILFGVLSLWGQLLAAGLLGMFSAFVGFNICHDAIHGSLSSHKRVNKIFAFVFNLVGASPYVWSITHNIVHHTYTNIPGHDEDIEVAPGLIRITGSDEIRPVQRFQHWYAFPLYGLASLSWVFRKDYKKFFQKKIGAQVSRHPKSEYVKLFAFKGLYYFLFILLPLLVLDISWWQFAIGFLVLHLVEGTYHGTRFPIGPRGRGNGFSPS